MPLTVADLQRVQLLIEQAMIRLEEQRNRLVWLIAIALKPVKPSISSRPCSTS